MKTQYCFGSAQFGSKFVDPIYSVMLKVRLDLDWVRNQHFLKVVLLARWRTLSSINGFNMLAYMVLVIGLSVLIGKSVNEIKALIFADLR